MSGTPRALALLFITTTLLAEAQTRDSAVTSAAAPGQRTFTSASRPQDLYVEWWLQLRNGAVIVADRNSIGYQGGTLEIRGTLRTLSIPATDVRAVSAMPSGNRFRDVLIGAGFLSSMMMLSPGNSPGYYLGTVRSGSYGNQSELQFPGLSAFGVLAAAGVSIGSAMIATSFEQGARATLLDGTEDERAWRLLLEEDEPRWHLRGAAGYVDSDAEADWKVQHDRYAISSIDAMTQSYYSTQTKYDMTAFNFGRLLRVGYSLSPRIEIGAGVQSEGVQRFYESFSFIRPGVPPQPVTQELASEGRVTSLYLLGQYEFLPVRPGGVSVHLGGGIGIAGVRLIVNNFRVNSGDVTLLDESRTAFIIFGGLEYRIDRGLSIGLHADFSSPGSPTIPTQNVIDYDGRSYLTIDSFRLSLASLGIGIGIGLHL